MDPQSPDGASIAGEAPAPPKPKPRDAQDIARGLAAGQVEVLVWADRVRAHPVGPKLAALDAWGPILSGTGLDPHQDLDRAFVASKSARDEDGAVFVAEHALSKERIDGAVESMIGKSDPPGSWVEGLGVRAAKVSVRGRTRIVALPTEKLLVVLPEELASAAVKFAQSGGVRDAEGAEAAVAVAARPAETLKGSRVPPIPETLSAAKATLTLTPDGGADIHVEAKSTSAEQAKVDAAALTAEIDRATSVKISVLRVRFFEPIRFAADGDRVVGDRHLSAQEIDRLLGLASAMIPAAQR
jgi:hypothetical protein